MSEVPCTGVIVQLTIKPGVMAALPLVRQDLVDLTFTRLGPLTPLRFLFDFDAAAPAPES